MTKTLFALLSLLACATNVAQTGSEISVPIGHKAAALPDASAKVEEKARNPKTGELLPGRWTYKNDELGISYAMSIFVDGRFEGSGTNTEGSFSSQGRWSLEGNVLVTNVTVAVVMNDGAQSSTNTVNESDVRSITDHTLTLKSSHSSFATVWRRQ